MKLRIKDDTLRLRFDQKELEQLKNNRSISSSIHFAPGATLVYQILETESSLTITYTSNTISVFLPRNKIDELVETDLVTIHEMVSLENGKTLEITIEKDFQCLAVREGEDETHSFPNPMAK